MAAMIFRQRTFHWIFLLKFNFVHLKRNVNSCPFHKDRFLNPSFSFIFLERHFDLTMKWMKLETTLVELWMSLCIDFDGNVVRQKIVPCQVLTLNLLFTLEFQDLWNIRKVRDMTHKELGLSSFLHSYKKVLAV